MNLGIIEAWSAGLPDAERHLREGAVLARNIGRPYLEVACLAQLGFASRIRPFATTRRRCQEAIALAERHGWDAEPIVAPALVTLAASLVWTGELGEGERWLQRTERALQTDTGPGIRLLVPMMSGMLQAGRGRRREALEEFTAAEHLRSQLQGSHALASQVTGWLLASQARAGLTGEARAWLAALDDERASSGEIRNARAVISLAEGNPAAALAAVADVLDGTAPVIGYVTVVETQLLAALAHRQLGDQRAANQHPCDRRRRRHRESGRSPGLPGRRVSPATGSWRQRRNPSAQAAVPGARCHVVRAWSRWRIMSAAATIFPIRHGSRLTLRRALNVIFSSEFPRSPIARTLLWAAAVRG
jgi:LuxR family maltose regulon positive regulatory protein